LIVGTGQIPVQLYVDLQCPACKRFDEIAGGTLRQYATTNKIKLTVTPVAFLDYSSENEYSSRAAAATACASDGNRLLEYVAALLANQPDESTAGPSATQLVETGKSIGLGGSFANCVSSHRYRTWIRNATTKARQQGINGVPAVNVSGKPLKNLTKDALVAAIG